MPRSNQNVNLREINVVQEEGFFFYFGPMLATLQFLPLILPSREGKPQHVMCFFLKDK